MVLTHKFFSARRTMQTNFSLASAPHVATDIAVPIDIFADEFKPYFHWLLSSSQGFIPPSSSASKLSSRRLRSHIVRLFMRFGGGIRPSLTIESNRDGETPIYPSDWQNRQSTKINFY